MKARPTVSLILTAVVLAGLSAALYFSTTDLADEAGDADDLVTILILGAVAGPIAALLVCWRSEASTFWQPRRALAFWLAWAVTAMVVVTGVSVWFDDQPAPPALVLGFVAVASAYVPIGLSVYMIAGKAQDFVMKIRDSRRK